MAVRIFLGYDSREDRAFEVSAASARQFGHEVIPLDAGRLRACGIFTRPVDTRGERWDLISGKPQSTDFALTRFSVPILAHGGLCLFADSDTVFMRDPAILEIDPEHAVAVVKHRPFPILAGARKMDGQEQKVYPRKLWSSVMLFNCDHPAHKRLTLDALNGWHRDDLHSFAWLSDDEIGELPPEANWLVGIQPKPERPIIAHFTLGTPDMKGHENDDHADLWLQRVSQR